MGFAASDNCAVVVFCIGLGYCNVSSNFALSKGRVIILRGYELLVALLCN